MRYINLSSSFSTPMDYVPTVFGDDTQTIFILQHGHIDKLTDTTKCPISTPWPQTAWVITRCSTSLTRNASNENIHLCKTQCQSSPRHDGRQSVLKQIRPAVPLLSPSSSYASDMWTSLYAVPAWSLDYSNWDKVITLFKNKYIAKRFRQQGTITKLKAKGSYTNTTSQDSA